MKLGGAPGVPERKVMSPEVHALGLTPFGIEIPPADCAKLVIGLYQLASVVLKLQVHSTHKILKCVVQIRTQLKNLPKDQKRISTYLSVQFKYKLDELLAQLEWSESEYVKRAIEEYFPKAVRLRDAIMENKREFGRTSTA
jgi:hypothetical protein